MELFRAKRLVIDTGLHAKRWTRAQAIEYLGPLPGLGTEAEVERYVSQPGQACSYMIGQLKIIQLREKSQGRTRQPVQPWPNDGTEEASWLQSPIHGNVRPSRS